VVSREQDESVTIISGNLKEVLDATDRQLVILKRHRDKDFVKLYGERLRRMIVAPANSPLGLTWNERAILLSIAPYVDYRTGIVLSPNECFRLDGKPVKCSIPASLSEIAEKLCQKDRRVVQASLRSLAEKGLVELVDAKVGNVLIKAVRLNPQVVFKGDRRRREGAKR